MQRLILLCLFATLFVNGAMAAAGDCYLRQNTSAAIDPAMTQALQPASKGPLKPFPSLAQCYKYNTEACCVSGHDAQIQEHFSGLLSSTCLREFPDLEVYMCLGCHPSQPKFVDVTTKTIRVCKSFAELLFKKDKATGLTKYDNCGLKYPGKGFILPSFHFNSELAFLNAYKPKLFEDFTIVIQEADDGYCFKSAAGKLVVSAMTILATVFFAIAMI